MATRSTKQFPVTNSSTSEPTTAARYRSEMFVPVVDGSSSSSNSTGLSSPTSSSSSSSSSWQTMHQRLDERRKQWNDEVSALILILMYCFSSSLPCFHDVSLTFVTKHHGQDPLQKCKIYFKHISNCCVASNAAF